MQIMDIPNTANEDISKSSIANVFEGASASSFPPNGRRPRNKSVQWADWELRDATDFSRTKDVRSLIDEYSQTEIDIYQDDDAFPLINGLVQTSMEISSVASSQQNSRSPSLVTCTTLAEDEERQAALMDLITHLEDTTALLREYLLSHSRLQEPLDMFANTSMQTIFLLKYQLILIFFTQFVSILLLSLFDQLIEKSHDMGYHILTISCGSVLQIFNMVLVSFATAVLSRQMLKYKVEGPLMAQTYLGTVITFAGLYFMIFRIQPKSWEFANASRMNESIAIVQFIQMLYLSVSAATLCGAANIQPNEWYVTIILCFQSLINFVYFASILAQTIGNYHSYTVQVRRSSSMRLQSKSR